MRIFYEGKELDLNKIKFLEDGNSVTYNEVGRWEQDAIGRDTFEKLNDALYRIEC